MSTLGEETPVSSSSAPTSTSEMIGISLEPTRQSNTAFAIGRITILKEFFKSLLDSQRATDTQLRVSDTKITTLYGQIGG